MALKVAFVVNATELWLMSLDMNPGKLALKNYYRYEELIMVLFQQYMHWFHTIARFVWCCCKTFVEW